MVSEHAETCAGASVSSAAADLLLVNGTPPGRTQDWARCLTTFPRGGSLHRESTGAPGSPLLPCQRFPPWLRRHRFRCLCLPTGLLMCWDRTTRPCLH